MSYQPPQQSFTTDGVTVTFNFTFELLQPADLKVYYTASGATFDPDTDLITAYTVNILTPPAIGGSITTDSPLATGTLTLVRDMELELATAFDDVTTFNGRALDTALHRLLLLIQDNNFLADSRALHYPINVPDVGDMTEVAILSDGQIWKRVGDNIIGVTPVDGDSTLRSELASTTTGSEGARLIGTTLATSPRNPVTQQEFNDVVYGPMSALAFISGLDMFMGTDLIVNFSGGFYTDVGGEPRVFGAGFTKKMATPWAAGTGANGLISTPTANDPIYIYVIEDTAGALDIAFSTSSTAADLPAGYILSRCLGFIINVTPFTKVGNRFIATGTPFLTSVVPNPTPVPAAFGPIYNMNWPNPSRADAYIYSTTWLTNFELLSGGGWDVSGQLIWGEPTGAAETRGDWLYVATGSNLQGNFLSTIGKSGSSDTVTLYGYDPGTPNMAGSFGLTEYELSFGYTG